MHTFMSIPIEMRYKIYHLLPGPDTYLHYTFGGFVRIGVPTVARFPPAVQALHDSDPAIAAEIQHYYLGYPKSCYIKIGKGGSTKYANDERRHKEPVVSQTLSANAMDCIGFPRFMRARSVTLHFCYYADKDNSPYLDVVEGLLDELSSCSVTSNVAVMFDGQVKERSMDFKDALKSKRNAAVCSLMLKVKKDLKGSTAKEIKIEFGKRIVELFRGWQLADQGLGA